MRKRFTCANGHEWEAPAGGGLAVAVIACPTCGAPAETVVTAGPADGLTSTAPAPRGRPTPTSSRPPGSGGPTRGPGEFGRYEIREELGRGGMGRVYKAFDRELRRVIALKVLHFRPDDADSLQRFKHEAQAAATFNHPNLCPVFDVGEHDGVPYLTMPFISGPSLAAVIDAARSAGKPFPERRVALVVRKLALALDHAHRKGVVHRDLKPSNVMIHKPDGGQEPLIMDFGLARTAAAGTRLTGTGVVMGTPGYMAPEQAAGLTKETGPGGDIYSLGVILYELLTLRLPFEPPAILYKITHEPPDEPSKHRPGLDPALEAICLRCLRKQPEERFASMKELAGALTDWLAADAKVKSTMREPAGRGPSVFADLAAEPERPARRRRPPRIPIWAVAAAGAAAAVVLLTVVIYVTTGRGTIRIELSEPAADVQVKVDGDVVTLASPDGTLTLKPGLHEMEVASDRFKTVTRTFTVKRGTNEPIKVTLEPRAVVATPAAPPGGEPDRPVAPAGAARPAPGAAAAAGGSGNVIYGAIAAGGECGYIFEIRDYATAAASLKVIAEYRTPWGIHDVAVSDTGTIYALGRNPGNIYTIDPATGNIQGPVIATGATGQNSLAWTTGDVFYTAGWQNGDIRRIDLKTGKTGVIATIPSGASDMAWDPTTDLLYVTTLARRLYQVNPADGTFAAIGDPDPAFRSHIAVDHTGQIYVARDGDEKISVLKLYQVDKKTGRLTLAANLKTGWELDANNPGSTGGIGAPPTARAVGRQDAPFAKPAPGAEADVLYGTASITPGVCDFFEIRGYATGSPTMKVLGKLTQNVSDIAVSDTGVVYGTANANPTSLVRINPKTAMIEANVLPAYANGQTSLAWATGNILYSAGWNSGDIRRIDLDTGKVSVVATLPAGAGDMAWDPTTGLLYVLSKQLYRVNPADGSFAEVGPISAMAIAIDHTGQMYATTGGQQKGTVFKYYKVDKRNAELTLVADFTDAGIGTDGSSNKYSMGLGARPTR